MVGIWNPENWNPESKGLESGIQRVGNPESNALVDSVTWGEKFIEGKKERERKLIVIYVRDTKKTG